MDRYDRIMNDILSKTRDDVLRWSIVRPGAFADILPKVDGVRRIVVADYPLGERSYRLCFIESTRIRAGDFGANFEFSHFEIFVLNDKGEVALTLADGVVERDDLLRLAGLIDEHNDQTKDFFEAFDRSGAA